MKPKIIIQKFTDEKYGKRLRILTPKEIVGVIGDNGSFEAMTVRPILLDVLVQIVAIGSNFDLFYALKEDGHVS